MPVDLASPTSPPAPRARPARLALPAFLLRWSPALVFAGLTFFHATTLPTFEGMDEPAHLSSILHFATHQGRPIPGRTRLHQSIERAVALVPGPYHQWDDARVKLGGSSYAQSRLLAIEEQERRGRDFKSITIDAWRDGQLENWEAQHPPLYYALIGYAISAMGISTLASAHLFARVMSAAMFATTGILLTAFITGVWGASRPAALFVTFLPMWYVMGARIANDALAIPALGLALLLALDQMRRPAAEWRLGAWLIAGTAGAIGIAAKAYALVIIPVAGIAAAVAASSAIRRGSPWRAVLFPSVAVVIALAPNAWWLAETFSRTGSIAGQNENVSLAAKGITTLGQRAPYLSRLVFEEPRQLASVIARGSGQALYFSNWTVGAAPWWFYIVQLAALGLIAGPIVRAAVSPLLSPLRAAVVVAGIAILVIGVGSAKSMLDYYILFGEARLAQGYYVWGAGCAFGVALALGFDASSRARRRAALVLQASCLLIALATDRMFWSGRYERDPVWRTPVRVESSTLRR